MNFRDLSSLVTPASDVNLERFGCMTPSCVVVTKRRSVEDSSDFFCREQGNFLGPVQIT